MKLNLIQSSGSDQIVQSQSFHELVKDNGIENEVVNIYTAMKDQSLEGFGGALTDASGYIFSLLDEGQKEQMLDKYFSPEQMNYQMVRIHMDSCDFSTHLYSADADETDENLEHFSFADTERYIIPLLDAAEKKAGRKLNIMLSPWSPPPFMKTNGERKNGGSLKKEYRKRYAEYLCRYIEEFRKRGYRVCRMSLQNEPKAVQTWDSCVYTAEEEKEFLRDFLYPSLQAHDLSDIEVFAWDHNKERLFERAQVLIDEKTDKMLSGMAFHWYSGDHFEALDLVRKQYPDKKLILSESCLEYCKVDASSEAANAGKLAHDLIGNLNHGMNAFYDWNILLDEKGGPNHVGNFCDAPFLYHTDTKELVERRSLLYYWHFTKFIQPGAVRIISSSYCTEIEVTAWENPDGNCAVVLLNRTDSEKNCTLRMDGEMVTIVLPAESISSGMICRQTLKKKDEE